MGLPGIALPVDDRRRGGFEGELTAQAIGNQIVLLLDQARLSELLTYKFKDAEGPRDNRNFGRVRLAVELLRE